MLRWAGTMVLPAHLVQPARRHYRAVRNVLVVAVERHLPRAGVTGLAAGLHAIIRLGGRWTEQRWRRRPAFRRLYAAPRSRSFTFESVPPIQPCLPSLKIQCPL